MATPAQYVLSWRQRWRRLWRENCREVGSLLYLGVQHVEAVEVLAVLVLLFVPDKVLLLLLVQGKVVLVQVFFVFALLYLLHCLCSLCFHI